jgi:DNA-binding IclR family transcriptional regulator
MSIREIADEIGIPKSTVHRIKKALALPEGYGNAE